MSNGNSEASSRPSKKHLLIEFDLRKSAQEDSKPKHEYFTCDAYPPSRKAIGDLASIGIAELKPETHHHDRVLFIRTLDSPFRDAALQTIVEDDTAAERLAVYNTSPSYKAEELLPEDAIFAIKEPYLCIVEGSTIRVDHPSDIVRINPLDPRVPKSLVNDTGKSALEWKTEGNSAYSSGRHHSAIYGYSRGLEVCGNDELKYDLRRNRSIVNMFLKRFEEGYEDGIGAVIPNSDGEGTDPDGKEKTDALNRKAHERAGRAAYELGHYEQAESCFKEMGNDDAIALLKRIKQRKAERSTGKYDFATMSKVASVRHNRLDYGSFTSNTEVRDAAERGRGLFATKNITAGQLILCEKALCVSFDSDAIVDSYTILDHNNKRALHGTQATLLYDLAGTLSHNHELAEKFFDLYDGYRKKDSLQSVDGIVPVDTFRIQKIIENNAFGCPNIRSSMGLKTYESTGLWVTAAYMNHACNGNAFRSFIGDMMIVRATREIAAGEEIMHPYRLPDADIEATQEHLQKTWGFKCQCGICMAEAASGPSKRKSRVQLVEKMKALTNLSPQQKANVNKVEQMLSKIRETYDSKAFENKPRLALVAPGIWLCQAYKHAGSHDQVIDTALAVLQDSGFAAKVSGKKVKVDRRNCQMDLVAVDAAMYASKAYQSKGNADIGGKWEALAKDIYLIMNGELRGFDEKYESW